MRKVKCILFLLVLAVIISFSGNSYNINPSTTSENESRNILDIEQITDEVLGNETSDETNDSSKSNHNEPDTDLDKNEKVPTQLKITAIGDIMLGRGVGSRIESQGKTYESAFEQVAHLVSDGDIVFANIETPITDRSHSLNPSGKIVLKSSTASFPAIKTLGVDVINLANNHIMDYYAEGLFDTISILEENDINYIGAGENLDDARKAKIVEKNDVKAGFIAYTDMSHYYFSGDPTIKFSAEENEPGVAPTNEEFIIEDINELRPNVDILVVSMHWGVEESFMIPQEQRDFAHRIIDAGADVILGHHPHQFQGIEIYNDKPIIYSMGNFVFDQNDPENQESFIINLEYEDCVLKEFFIIPVHTIEKTHVELQTGEQATHILHRQMELNLELDTISVIEGDTMVFHLNN